MDRFDPFVKYADVYGDIINWEKDPMNKPQNQNKYFFSDGKTYYEQICKMLRLMSVFKEAFNQIYNNEDGISEAWENFVNNLSASVVEGSEPDVTLTWTDDSVNFEFTMVPGVPGEQGVGITSISFNSDYTMTITLSDGNTYTSMSLKGETGPQGPQGETGSGLQILDVYATLADLQSAHPTGQPGDAYQVGSAGNYTLYIWSSSQSAWVQAGTLGTVSPYTSAPLMDGTASAGSQNLYARGDHVHPTDTSRASQEELDALIKTSHALIDQSFTYRESPAIQDGLAKLDKIKGNTLKWNQLVENGNFASTSRWSVNNITTYSVANNILTFSFTANDGFIGHAGIPLVKNHKYIWLMDFKTDLPSPYRENIKLQNYRNGGWSIANRVINNDWNTYSTIFTFTEDSATVTAPFFRLVSYTDGAIDISNSNQIRNVQVFDLTQMGLDSITEPSEFTSLFSLPYYAYNQGTLLSFNGTGLKTVGFNQWDGNSENGKWVDDYSTGAVSTAGSNYNVTDFIHVFPNITYYHTTTGSRRIMFYDGNKNPIPMTSWEYPDSAVTIVSPPNAHYIRFTITNDYLSNFCFNISDQSKDGTYEPYTSSTLSLPISTYFPNGMDGVGTDYDELTNTKATTRMTRVDLGSLDWNYNPTYGMYSTGISNSVKKPSASSVRANAISTIGTFTDWATFYASGTTSGLLAINTSGYIGIATTETDSTTFKNSLQGVYLVYPLATPTETAVDLDLSFNAYENGTEQLLPVNGPVPSTSPIIADMTYLSIDDAMEYIIDKLANVPQNTQQILESLEDDVSDLQTDVGALQPAVSGLQTSVGNINTNIGQLSSTVAGHTASISDMQSDITDLNTGLSDLGDTVTDNTSRIGTLETGLATTNGNVQSLSSQVQSIDGRVTNLESDLFKVVVKEFDYDTVASESNFGTTTPITQEEGYRVIGVVGTEAQAGEYTSPASNIAITQCHIYYTSLGALTITIFGRNTGLSARTNVRIYAYLLCIKDIQ